VKYRSGILSSCSRQEITSGEFNVPPAHEIRTGELLSDAGHSIKAQEIINGLQKLVNSGTLSQADTATAKSLIEDLRSALSTSPWMR
jgi:hypothetical protein